MYFLAVDIGASSGRCVLGWVSGGVLKHEEIHRFPNEIVENNGTLCWNMDSLFGEIITGMKKCAEMGKIPESVGVDTWGVDFVLLDDENRVLGNSVSYRDSRTNGIEKEVPILDSELYARTGIQKIRINTIYQLMAVKRQDKKFSCAKKILILPDYFHFLLCGIAKTEYTNATTTGLVNAKSKSWDEEIISACGLPREIFCEIVPPGTVLGWLLPETQQAVGYNCRVVLPATHDTASAVVCVPDDAIFISSGTWSLMGVKRDEPDCTEQSRAKNFTNEGGYNFCFRYLKNIMGLWSIQCIKREFNNEVLTDSQGNACENRFSFAELSEMAENAKTTSAININDSRLLSPQNMIATIQQLCGESGLKSPKEPGEIAAVIYNSLAQSYSRTAAELEALTGKNFEKIYIVGGGAKAKYLNKLTEKLCNKTVFTGETEATAIGNLTVQMKTAGVL